MPSWNFYARGTQPARTAFSMSARGTTQTKQSWNFYARGTMEASAPRWNFYARGSFRTPYGWNFYARGSFVAEDVAQYELYHGLDGPPDFTAAPDETFTTLPHTTTATYTAEGTHHFVLRTRNIYGVSQNIDAWKLTIDASGNEVVAPPNAPFVVSAAATAGRTLRVQASYRYAEDDNEANRFMTFIGVGSSPNPDISPARNTAMVKVDGIAKLDESFGPLTEGVVYYVIVRTQRSSDSVRSTNTDEYTATATDSGPAASTNKGARHRRNDKDVDY